MVSFHPPAPGFGIVGRVAENRPGVEQRVALPGNAALFLFQRAEDGFVVNNQARLAVGFLGEAGGHQGVSLPALLGGHIPQGQAVAVQRRVVPENAFAVVVAVADGGLLGGVQAGQQGDGGGAHFGGGLGVRMVVVVTLVVMPLVVVAVVVVVMMVVVVGSGHKRVSSAPGAYGVGEWMDDDDGDALTGWRYYMRRRSGVSNGIEGTGSGAPVLSGAPRIYGATV